MKKALLFLLILSLLCALTPCALAADDSAKDAADRLNALVLFVGRETNEDGTPIYDLETPPTRMEAVTMLVRLLGKEDEAKAGTWDMPFTDVKDWAKPYVGYAYANGLTKGTGETTFGATALVTASQYLTFVLRALGYDSDTDFRWDAAWEFSDRLGLTAGEYNAVNDRSFLRGDIAVISAGALEQSTVDRNGTLLDALIADGSVSVFAADAAGFETEAPENGAILSIPAERTEKSYMTTPENEIIYSLSVRTEDLLRLFPNADALVNGFVRHMDPVDQAFSEALSDALYKYRTKPSVYTGSLQQVEEKLIQPRDSYYYFLLDAEGNTLAYFYAAELYDCSDSIPLVVWRKDYTQYWAELMEKLDRAVEACRTNRFTVDLDTVAREEQDGSTWHDIYMNGVKMSELPGTFALRRSIFTKGYVERYFSTEEGFREKIRETLFERMFSVLDPHESAFGGSHIRIDNPNSIMLFIVLNGDMEIIGYFTVNLDLDYTVA